MKIDVPTEMCDAILIEAIKWHHASIAKDIGSWKHEDDVEMFEQTLKAFEEVYNYFTGQELCRP